MSSSSARLLPDHLLHVRCKKNLRLMAAGKELPLQQGKPVCSECATKPPPNMKRKEMDSDSELFGGYDVTDSFVNDGSIDESEWTEEEEEKAAIQAAIQARVIKKRRKLIRPPVEESDDDE